MRQRMIYRVPKTKDELLALLTRPRVHCVDRALIFNSASDLGALKEFQQMCPSEFPERLPSRSITRDCKTVIYVNRGDLVPLNAGLFQIEGHDSNRSEGWVPLIYEWRSSYPAWRLDANLLTRGVELSTLKTIIEAVLHPAKVTVGPSYNSREAERLRFTIEGGDFNKFQLSQLVGREAAKRGYRRRGKAQIKTDRVHVHANHQIEADMMEGYMNWLKHILEDDINQSVGRGQKARDKSPWATLELAPGATHAEIKSAYRRLAHKHHPDLNTDADPARFYKLTEARDKLLALPQKARDKGLSDVDKARLKKLRDNLKKMIGSPVIPPGFIDKVRTEIRTIAMRMKKQGR